MIIIVKWGVGECKWVVLVYVKFRLKFCNRRHVIVISNMILYVDLIIKHMLIFVIYNVLMLVYNIEDNVYLICNVFVNAQNSYNQFVVWTIKLTQICVIYNVLVNRLKIKVLVKFNRLKDVNVTFKIDQFVQQVV